MGDDLAATPEPMPPLSGLRVLDQTSGWGQLCGRLLSDLGADVVRVEPPGSPALDEAVLHEGHDLSSAVRNLGKATCVIDTTTPAGEAQLRRLLEHADVWLESSAPGSHGSSPFDPERIHRDLPHLIVTSITPFGQDGPYRDFEATDPTL